MSESPPRLSQLAAMMVKFAADSGAVLLDAAIDQGPESSPALVEYQPLEETFVVSEGEESRIIEDLSFLEGAQPFGAVHVHAMPPFEVDVELGEIVGALGGLDHLASAVTSVAKLLPGNSVFAAHFPTQGGAPLELVARSDGEIAIHCDGVDFETPEGWLKA